MVEIQDEVINVVVLGPHKSGKSSLVGRLVAEKSDYWTEQSLSAVVNTLS